MVILEITKIQDLLNIKDVWDQLLLRNETKSSELGFNWVTTWWRYCCSDSMLFVLLAKDNDKLLGIAPLMISETSDGNSVIKKLEFIAASTSNYADFIIA
jgi:CelD/BcsL family acetyltransferase involved in cellulose biosynthesis